MKRILGTLLLIILLLSLTACGGAQTSKNNSVLFEGVRPGQTVQDVKTMFSDEKKYTVEERENHYELIQKTEYLLVIGKTDNSPFTVFGYEAPYLMIDYDPVKERTTNVSENLSIGDIYGADMTNVVTSLNDSIAKIAELKDTTKNDSYETYLYNIQLEEKPYILKVYAVWGDKELNTNSHINVSIAEP
jgi:hypothetical protein